ncbi:MAG: RND family transporter [FCB group bacterium]|nr:RND family transporter [FCB group bacterium]
MKRLADIIIRNRVTIIIVVVLLTLFLGYETTKIKLNADFSSYLQQDNPLVQKFNRIGEIFAGKSIAMVTIESEDIFSAKTLALIRNLTNAYEDLDGVSHVTSLTNIIDFKKTEWGLEVGKLIPKGEIPETPEELKKLKDYVMSKEMYVGDLVSEDGKASIIVLRITAGANEIKVVKELRQITEKIAPSMDNIAFGGMPSLMDSMILLISENMTVLLPIMVALIFLVLIIAFRKPGGIFLPLIIVGLATVFTMGLLVLFGLSLDLLTGIMPVILLAMGSADGIHFMKRYYEIRRTGKIPETAVKETLAELWMPMLITTMTTMIGFASLTISEFSVITQFGLVTAVAIFLALVITFTFLPAVLSFSRNKVTTPRKVVAETSNRFLEGVGDFIYNNKVSILVSAAVIVAISLVAIPRIVKDVDWSLCLQKGSKPYRAEMLLREKFGGSLPIQVLVDGNIKDPATLKIMRYTERYLNSVPLVSESQSIASLISEINYVMNDRYIVPETRAGVANLWFMIEGEDILEQMITTDNKEALIQGKLATMATKPLVLAVDKINRFIENLPGDLAVFDLRDIPPRDRAIFTAVRSKDITDKIIWDLQYKGLNVERNQIAELVDAALTGTTMNKEAYDELRQKVTDYFLSDEAELEITSEDKAEAIAGKIVKRLKRGEPVSTGQISGLIKSEIEGVDNEDVDYLAESLRALISETLGEIKVKSALQALIKILPPGSGEIRDLFKDLKGDLWEINENLVIMNLEDYRKIAAGSDLPKARELRLTMDQTGLAPVLKHMEAVLAPSQIYSLLIALVFVVLILALMLRSAIGGIISVIPISMTILFNFAVMGYLGIGLDSFTSMIASIAIGLGIDYAVHFNSRFRRELFNLKDEKLALKKTLGTTGVAIIINALTVGLGFSVLLLAGGQHIRRFGGLTALTMLTSAVFTLMVLPALTLMVKPKYLKKQKSMNNKEVQQ